MRGTSSTGRDRATRPRGRSSSPVRLPLRSGGSCSEGRGLAVTGGGTSLSVSRARASAGGGWSGREQRPHRAIGRRTPGEAYRALPKDRPSGPEGRGHFRLRYDTTDSKGAMTLRRAGRLHHLKVGQAHARRRVLAVVGEQEVMVVALDTGEILSSHLIEPEKGYWRNTRRDPGRWPGSQQTG